jgi:hypothetical protein
MSRLLVSALGSFRPLGWGVVKFPTTKRHVINFALGLRVLAEAVSV